VLLRFIATRVSSLALSVVAAALSLPAVACEDAAAQSSASKSEDAHSKVASNPGNAKATPANGWNSSGLSDAEVWKRTMARCRARPELCVKQPDGGDSEPPRDPPSDKGPSQ
jgi:hypothetical protein